MRREPHEAGITDVGGGVLIVARESLSPKLVFKGGSGCELIWAKLALSKRSLYVRCCYVPPRSPPETYQAIVDGCKSVTDSRSKNDEAVLISDFNLPRLRWAAHDDLENVFVPINVISETETLAIDNLLDQGFFQMHNGTNVRGNVLDLVFL